MTVTVYARHSRKCSKSGERGAGQYKRCKCSLWLRWGKDGKKSAKTRSWDIATKAARKLEEGLELAANGIEASEEGRPHHHRVGSRSLPQRHDPACPREANNRQSAANAHSPGTASGVISRPLPIRANPQPNPQKYMSYTSSAYFMRSCSV
jgi:hypothetical protein